MTILFSDNVVRAWKVFLNNQENRGHIDRGIDIVNIEQYVQLCLESAIETTVRLKRDLPDGFEPKSILEIGSSAGLNCFALHLAYPDSRVIGVEPENEAVSVAQSMVQIKSTSPKFVIGFGEALPFDSSVFDLIICHTVIEHVQDVSKVIAELSRVLTNDGLIHLDAPNYIWPFEPHLEIYTIPVFGKWFVKLTAILQGKRKKVEFLDHLQFVTPRQLERLFKKNGLAWQNRAEIKLLSASQGCGEIKMYKKAASFLALIYKIGISRIFIRTLLWLGLYPSVMYTLQKHTK